MDPIVALTLVHKIAMSENKKTVRGLSNASLPFANLLIRYAPLSPSREFPIAINKDVGMLPVVVMLTKNAPTKIAGKYLYPKIKNVANAIPVGGHKAVVLGLTEANERPIFPAAK